MIDTDNLRTASLYINNQLLSRGLLQDGHSIDFANPEKGDADVSATMARIMSIVNDLILRRDRDAEHRESLSTAMRGLRSENLRYTKDVARLEEKCTEAQRKLDIAESSEAAAKTQLKSAEAAVRGLKDDVARTKTLVSQARSSCATEVRRRDRQIDALKKQLGEAGRARGSRTNPAITTINVTTDAGAQKPSPKRGASTSAEEYTLRSETNDFLANLAQNLSEENEAILSAMRRTMEQLREMSGWTDGREDGLAVKQPGWEDMSSELDSVLEHMKTILTNPSFVPIEEVMVREEEINRLKDGWVKMEDRWKDAVRLIDGWRQRMAANGRPICDEELQMGLRLSPVRVQDAYEHKQSRDFHLSAVAEEAEESMVAREPSPCPSVEEESLELVPADDSHGRDASHAEDGVDYEDNSDQEEDIYNDYEEEEDEPNIQILHQSSSVADVSHPDTFRDSSPLPEPPRLSPLKNSPAAGNRGNTPSRNTKQKTADFTTIVEENTWDLSVEKAPPQPPPHLVKPAKQQEPEPFQAENQTNKDSRRTRTSLEDALLPMPEEETSAPEPEPRQEQRVHVQLLRPQSAIPPSQSPRRGASRLPLPRNAESAPQQSPLTMATIAAKLAASEREADAARVRAKLKAVRATRGVARPVTAAVTNSSTERDAPPATESEQTQQQQQQHSTKGRGSENMDTDPVKQDPVLSVPKTRSSEQEEGKGQDQGQEPQIKLEKRKRDRRTSKVTSRRRSTLSPWELESLISGKVQ